MAWIRYEDLNYKNCSVNKIRFIKSPSKRRVEANLYLNAVIWIEAQLHVEERMALRLRKRSKKSGVIVKGFDCCYDTWQRAYCDGVHLSIYIHDDKMYSKSKNELREFKNPWLFKQITRKAFK